MHHYDKFKMLSIIPELQKVMIFGERFSEDFSGGSLFGPLRQRSMNSDCFLLYVPSFEI